MSKFDISEISAARQSGEEERAKKARLAAAAEVRRQQGEEERRRHRAAKLRQQALSSYSPERLWEAVIQAAKEGKPSFAVWVEAGGEMLPEPVAMEIAAAVEEAFAAVGLRIAVRNGGYTCIRHDNISRCWEVKKEGWAIVATLDGSDPVEVAPEERAFFV